MKGAATVGSIMPTSSEEAELTHGDIVESPVGTFTIKNMKIKTKEEKKYYVVFNIHGVETGFMDSNALIEIKQTTNIGIQIFNFVESFFAFGIATVIIMTAGYKFPFYLIGVCYLTMGIFGYYVLQKKEKSLSFKIVIFSLLCINAILLAWVTFIRVFYKRQIDTPYFFA